MGRLPKQHFIRFGPPIPIVPLKDFSTFASTGLTKEQFDRAWGIVGPSVEHNMRKGLDMWKIITSAYLEGLCHGAGIERERQERKINGERSDNPGQAGAGDHHPRRDPGAIQADESQLASGMEWSPVWCDDHSVGSGP